MVADVAEIVGVAMQKWAWPQIFHTHFACISSSVLASFPGSPSPFLTFFSRANITREKLKERESLVRNRAHPWPPWPAMTIIMAATRSTVHSAALTLPCGS